MIALIALLATVTGSQPPASYICSGGTVYTIPFPYLSASQVVATQTDSAGVTTTVIGTVKPSIAPSTGTITLSVACPSGSTLKLSRNVAFTQPQSFRTGAYSGPVHEQTFDRLEMQLQQLSTTIASGVTLTTPIVFVTGADSTGAADSSGAFQAALNTGKSVYCPSGTYKIVTSLYMITSGQELWGDCTLTMDNTLAKPILWIGASDATGTDNGVGVLNVKVRGIRFSGTGTRTLGSAGIAFKRATTTTLDSVYSWNFYAGIDIRGISIVNQVRNADLRQNNYGLYDRNDGSGTINFQASQIVGGRIESNVQEGVILGSPDCRFVGTIIEGNSNQGQGGTGTNPEVRITPGFLTGSVDFTDVYMETLVANTSTSMIQLDDPATRSITLKGGSYYANSAANRYIIKSNSTSTALAFSIIGGQFKLFKNYISGAIVNGGTAIVMPTSADASRDVSVDLSATAGATIFQIDRLLGVKTTGLPIVGNGVTTPIITTTAATGTTGMQMVTGSFLNLGGGTTLKGDVSGQVTISGNLFAGSSGNGIIHASQLQNDGTASNLYLKGAVPDNSSAIGVLSSNGTTLTNAAAKIHCFAPDNGTTKVACVDLKGAYVPAGVTFANLATGSTANGTIQFCTDCAPASSPCTGSSTGSLAVRQNGAWKCF